MLGIQYVNFELHTSTMQYVRRCGVPLADTERYDDALLIKFIPNARSFRDALTGDFSKDKALCSAVRESLYPFLLLGGWDMLGLQMNNVLVDELNKPIFIDFGAAYN